MSDTSFSKIARKVTEWSGSLWATAFAFVLVIAWVLGGLLFFGFSDFYQIIINTVTTIITFLMVFLIQHTQNHDTKALHIKIDSLIFSIKKADNSLINIEALDEEQLAALGRRYKKIADNYRYVDDSSSSSASK